MINVFIGITPMATVNSKLEKARGNKNFARFNYPQTPGEHNIILVFREYDYQSSQRGFISGAKAESRISAGVSLPIPQNLVDSYNVKVGPYELGVMGATALDAISSSGREAMLADAQSAANALSNAEGADGVTLSGLASTFKAASAYMGRNALDKLPGGAGISAAIDLQSGSTINPHVALKFDGVDLKQHTFNWQLSPRNEAEADDIRKMISFIKGRMLPNYKGVSDGSSSLSKPLLTYPNLIDIYFTGINQSYFYHFKPAMINSFTTDFTPQGLALNKGGKPAFINMTMTVTEAQIHTRSDIEDITGVK
jgi:hypothetical protein